MMNVNKTYNYFKSKFDITESSNGWHRFYNPFESGKSKSMGVNFAMMHVKCFRANYSKSINDFIKDFERTDYIGSMEIVEAYHEIKYEYRSIPAQHITTQKLPPFFMPLLGSKGAIGKKAKKYLQGRGFDLQFLDSQGIGYCYDGEWRGRIIVPFKQQGRLVYFLGRSFMQSKLRYKNPTDVPKSHLIYNQDALILYDHVYIFEGLFDALTLGKNAVAIQGWALADYQLHLFLESPTTRFTVVADKGFYIEACKQYMKLAQHKKVDVVSLDTCEEPKADINLIGLKRFKKLEKNKTRLTHKLLLKLVA